MPEKEERERGEETCVRVNWKKRRDPEPRRSRDEASEPHVSLHSHSPSPVPGLVPDFSARPLDVSPRASRAARPQVHPPAGWGLHVAAA